MQNVNRFTRQYHLLDRKRGILHLHEGHKGELYASSLLPEKGAPCRPESSPVFFRRSRLGFEPYGRGRSADAGQGVKDDNTG